VLYLKYIITKVNIYQPDYYTLILSIEWHILLGASATFWGWNTWDKDLDTFLLYKFERFSKFKHSAIVHLWLEWLWLATSTLKEVCSMFLNKQYQWVLHFWLNKWLYMPVHFCQCSVTTETAHIRMNANVWLLKLSISNYTTWVYSHNDQ